MIENIFYYFVIIILFLNIGFIFYHNDIARFFQLYDEVDNKRKIHRERVAITGGIYIFTNFILLVTSQIILDSVFGLELPKNSFYSLEGIFSAVLLFFLGLYDDKYIMSANIKFLISIIIVGAFITIEQSHLIRFLRFDFLDINLNVYKYRYVFTLLCFLLFMNACNMFDGINGQSSIYFIFLSVYIQIISGLDLFLIFLFISLLIFLYLNLNNKSFLGDGGIYLLSFIFASIIIKKFQLGLLYADQIFLIMLIPGFDMFRLFIQRIIYRKNPFSADNMHIHHLLMKKFSLSDTILIVQLLIIIPNAIAFIFNAYMLISILTIITYLLLLKNLNVYSKKN